MRRLRMLTLLLLCTSAAAEARPFGVVVRDNAHVPHADWGANRPVRYLSCSESTCTEALTLSIAPDPTLRHPQRVASIMQAALLRGTGGDFPRGLVLYSMVGSERGLYNWLLEPVSGGRARAEARDIRVVVDTLSGFLGDAAACAALSGDPRLHDLRVRGVTYYVASGNEGHNGICGTQRRTNFCDTSARIVVGFNPQFGSDRPDATCQQRYTGDLWVSSNILDGRYFVGAPASESSWVPVGTDSFGTSWSTPGVAGGHLAVADRAPYRSVGEIEGALVAGSNSSFQHLLGGAPLSIPLVTPDRYPTARAAACTAPDAPLVNGWWWDRRNGGSGVHVFTRGNNVVFGWFTYAANGRPTWRIGDGTRQPDGSVSGRLLRFTRAGASPQEGTFSLDRCDATAMNLRWTLHAADGELGSTRGVESLQRFCFDNQPPLPNGACPGVPPPNKPDLTGIYYQLEKPNEGYSVETQGNLVGIVNYLFDVADQPTWATALVATTSDNDWYTVPMNINSGAQACLVCIGDGTTVAATHGGKRSFTLHYPRWMPRIGEWMPLGGSSSFHVPTDASLWPYAAINQTSPTDDTWHPL